MDRIAQFSFSVFHFVLSHLHNHKRLSTNKIEGKGNPYWYTVFHFVLSHLHKCAHKPVAWVQCSMHAKRVGFVQKAHAKLKLVSPEVATGVFVA